MTTSAWNPLAPFILLWRHRDLLRQFTRRTIEQRHRGSFLGFVWTILTPLLSLALYTFVFGHVLGTRYGVVPDETRFEYALGLFLGLAIFQFIGEILAQASTAIVTQPNFVKKVVFPLEVLPVAIVGAAAFNAAVSLTLAITGIAVLGRGLDAHALLLLAILPPVALIGLGCAWFLAALGVFVRDVANAMPFLVQVLVYTSFVFFPLSLVQGTVWWTVLRWNPLLHAVDGARHAVLWQMPVNAHGLLYLWLSGLAVCFAGYFFFSKTRSAFADVL
ncbi:MAG TPA: ABC transporter permease [Opitutus sp.]|nr:ABC transporter permease [Opitutus sp.]